MRDEFRRLIRCVRARRVHRWLFAVVCSSGCYTASVSVTAPGVLLEQLALVQPGPPLFVRDTVRLNISDTLRMSFLPLSSGDVAVRGVLLRWQVGMPQVLRLVGSTEQDAVADVRLVAESSGTTIVTATTTNASTRSGQPLTWRGVVIVR